MEFLTSISLEGGEREMRGKKSTLHVTISPLCKYNIMMSLGLNGEAHDVMVRNQVKMYSSSGWDARVQHKFVETKNLVKTTNTKRVVSGICQHGNAMTSSTLATELTASTPVPAPHPHHPPPSFQALQGQH